MSYDLEEDGAHKQLQVIEKSLRAAIETLNDARIYYGEDPTDHNLLLLRQAKLKARRAEQEKSEFLESLEEDDGNYPWD